MILKGAVWMCAFAVCAGPVAAVEFDLPATARLTAERDTSADLYDAPIGVFSDNTVPTITLEGAVRRSAWQIGVSGLTPFQVMRPLRAQLITAGYEVALDCGAKACGGFDFRFAVETLPGPNMYVNIRAYHFVTGLKTVEGKTQSAVTLLASTSATSAYVQIIHAGDQNAVDETAALAPSADLPARAPISSDALADVLLDQGYVVLSDLDFESGSAALGQGRFDSLTALARFLQSAPDMRVALVGHTDTVGGLQANIAVSRARAASVRQRLIDAHDIAPDRMDAEGMGYLSPVATNLDPAGREQNRRVEVVLLGAP